MKILAVDFTAADNDAVARQLFSDCAEYATERIRIIYKEYAKFAREVEAAT